MDSTIVALRTFRFDRIPGAMWLEIETADGRVGLGESFGATSAMAAWFRDEGAAYLLDKDADQIERHWWAIFGSWPPSGIGLEARVLSMMDQALWDLFAKRAGLPLVGVLGGAVRPNIRAYNTCAGPAYGEDSAPGGDYAGIRQPGGEYEDLWAFRNQADVLAEDLIATGFGAMKIWPFDEMADETGGKAISQQQLARGLEPIRKIREKVGNRIDVAIELHARWDVATAMVIAHALEPYNPLWIEDPIWFDNPAEMAQIVAHTSSTIAAGENLGAFYRYTELIGSGLGLVIADPMFCGGVTAIHRSPISRASTVARSPATTAQVRSTSPWGRTSHCTRRTRGTRRWSARSIRLVQEVATGLPRLEQGRLSAIDAPGHGITLRPELRTRPDAHIEETSNRATAH